MKKERMIENAEDMDWIDLLNTYLAKGGDVKIFQNFNMKILNEILRKFMSQCLYRHPVVVAIVESLFKHIKNKEDSELKLRQLLKLHEDAYCQQQQIDIGGLIIDIVEADPQSNFHSWSEIVDSIRSDSWLQCYALEWMKALTKEEHFKSWIFHAQYNHFCTAPCSTACEVLLSWKGKADYTRLVQEGICQRKDIPDEIKLKFLRESVDEAKSFFAKKMLLQNDIFIMVDSYEENDERRKIFKKLFQEALTVAYAEKEVNLLIYLSPFWGDKLMALKKLLSIKAFSAANDVRHISIEICRDKFFLRKRKEREENLEIYKKFQDLSKEAELLMRKRANTKKEICQCLFIN